MDPLTDDCVAPEAERNRSQQPNEQVRRYLAELTISYFMETLRKPDALHHISLSDLYKLT